MLSRRRPLRLTHGAIALAIVACGVPAPVSAVDLKARLNGSIVGLVRGPSGVAQMGATVILLDRFDHLVQRVLTNDRGAFGFDSLSPDTYSVQVLQTSFAPASKGGVRVSAGERSFLAIQLASLVSSIQLMGTAPGAASLMSDEWKWVLRGSSITRPVLRFLPSRPPVRIDDPASAPKRHAFFSDTRGILALSAGEASNSQAASIADMGTAFALSTQVFGSSQVMFSGNVGYSLANGMPAAGFRTAYRRTAVDDAFFNPEFKLTVQQVYLPMNTSQRFGDGAMSGVRSMSAAVSDRVKISDRVTAQVGASLDSVSFGSRMNYISPYALATVSLDDLGAIELGFSSGIPPSELYRTRRGILHDESEADLHQNVNALALMPRITMRDGAARVQRSVNYEASYRKKLGSRTISAGFFSERLSNAALTMASPDGAYPTTDVIPDFNSQSAVFNIGDYSRTGFTAAGSQSFGDVLTVALIFSRAGVLRSDQSQLITDAPDEIRRAIHRDRQNAVSTRISGVIPGAGTMYAASYQWTDGRALTPGHLFLTNLSSPDAGFNVSVRQRVPAPPFMSGRMELSAEMRNMLAQGYLPLTTAGGRQLLLIHTPRALRGGVAFFF